MYICNYTSLMNIILAQVTITNPLRGNLEEPLDITCTVKNQDDVDDIVLLHDNGTEFEVNRLSVSNTSFTKTFTLNLTRADNGSSLSCSVDGRESSIPVVIAVNRK